MNKSLTHGADSTHSNPAPAAAAFPWRRFASDARLATIFNVGAAILVTALTMQPSDFPANLVFSLCIGMIAFVLIDGIRLKLMTNKRVRRWYYFVPLMLVSAVIAQFGGTFLACLLLGITPPTLTSMISGRNSSMLILTVLATAGITMVFVNRERALVAEAAMAQEKARAEAVQRQALQTQLQLLQAQIEPHMLFNTLANLQGMIAIDPHGAQHMLDQLIQYLRATLSSSRARTTTLAQDFALMDAYLGLMSVRMGRRLSFTLTLPDALGSIALPPMLLQPLVENAIIHGLEPKMDGGHVSVAASRDGDMLALTVTDTGLGLDRGSASAGTQLGVANTRERLRAIYGERATFSLEPNSPCGATARLTLPVQPS